MTAFPPVSLVEGPAAPLLRDNIDTDQIIPSREIKGVSKSGLADGLFASWRYLEGRTPDPAFVLNRPAFAHAPILLAGANMGCGSSRERAVWALHEWGVRAVIAAGFAPIFRSNCIRNGIVPVELPVGTIARLGERVVVDLLAQQVRSSELVAPFDIDAEAKAMLAGGLDAIELTLRHRDAIHAFLAADRTERPWIYLERTA